MKRSTRMRVAALKKHRPFYEAVDAHARRRLKKHRPFYEEVEAHARRRLKSVDSSTTRLQSDHHNLTSCYLRRKKNSHIIRQIFLTRSIIID